MSTPTPPLGPFDGARIAIRQYGAIHRDLTHLGYSDYRARQLLQDTTPDQLAPGDFMALPPTAAHPQIAALVAVSEIALRYARHGIYLRDTTLRLPVHLRATHIGWSQEGRVSQIRPITRRWRIGSYQAIPATGVVNAATIMAEADVSDWGGPTMLYELGEPRSVNVELGYKPNPKGGLRGIAGTRHYLVDDLLNVADPASDLHQVPLVGINTV